MVRVIRNALLILITLLFTLKASFASTFKNEAVYNNKSDENSKKIALTFDDGPHPRQTVKILEVLKKYDIKATFFVIGINAKNYPEALSQVIISGHEVGNHTYTHNLLESKSIENVYDEIISTENEIIKNGGVPSKLIRPPCGKYDSSLVKIANENEYKIVLWNVDTKDWAHNSCRDIVSAVSKKVNGGDIILFHDYVSGESHTVEALEIIIPRLLQQGYEFVTVSELLR